MKRSIILIALAFVVILAICGCSEKKADPPATTSPGSQTAAGDAAEEATSDPNITINKAKKQVTVVAEVNGKYFTEGTKHAVSYKDGGNGEKSLLRSQGSQLVFHQALIDLGFKPGDNVKLEDMDKGVKNTGDQLDVFVSWDGKEVPFADVFEASEERPIDIRFAGNIEAAKEKNAGCLLCFDSCAVGITTNAAYETGASNTIKFNGKSDVLPADGTTVKVIFRARAN